MNQKLNKRSSWLIPITTLLSLLWIVGVISFTVWFFGPYGYTELSHESFVGIYLVEAAKDNGHITFQGDISLSLTLNTDGSFVATNVPANFFFKFTPTAATPQARGTWSVMRSPEKCSMFYSNEPDQLRLDFDEPYNGLFSTPVESWAGSIRMELYYRGARYFLVKQK